MSSNGFVARAINRHASLRRRQHNNDPAPTDKDEDPLQQAQDALSSFLHPKHTSTVAPPKVNTPNPVPTVTKPKAADPVVTPVIPTTTAVVVPKVTPTTSSVPLILPTPSSVIAVTPTTSHTSTSVHSTTTSSKAATQTPVNATAADSKGNSNSSGLAIGIALTVVALCAFGAIFWFIRRRRIRERSERRNSWNTGFQATAENKRRTWLAPDAGVQPLMAERSSFEPKTPTSPNMSKPLPDPLATRGQFVPPMPPIDAIAPPPSTANNPSVVMTPTLRRSSQGSLIEMARIKRGFLPSLPDELPVSIGEMLRLVSAFDDGWCQCENSRGDRGMVPLECLERSASVGMGGGLASQEGSGDARMSRRASSLYVGVVGSQGY